MVVSLISMTSLEVARGPWNSLLKTGLTAASKKRWAGTWISELTHSLLDHVLYYKLQNANMLLLRQLQIWKPWIWKKHRLYNPFEANSQMKIKDYFLVQGHHELSGKSDENKSFKPNQIAPSIYIMIELCYFSLDQWEITIHLLWGKCFNIPHWPRSHSTNGRLQHIEDLSKSSSLWPSFRPNQI